MSLIKCNECGKIISAEAIMCPNCGKALKPIITEQTKKKWKLVKLISVLVIIGSIYMSLYGFANGGFDKNPLAIMGISLAFLGFIILGIAKFGAWWSNK